MLFSSISFIYYFLPVALLLYYIIPRPAKNAILLLLSLFFYFCGEPIYILLLVFSSLADYTCSLLIEKFRGTSRAKAALIASLCINLAMLGFFKYTDFFISNVNALLGTAIPLLKIPLPLGISFFTFQTMSYTIDVYRGEVKAQKNLVNFASYVTLFPQLVAGPIVRYSDVNDQLESRTHSLDKIGLGVQRFIIGLGKKVLIANQLGELCASLSGIDSTVGGAWIGGIAYALQIYFDFSGYSDMAIGLGHMLGFDFPENFNYPFIASSITEFWRRWHMTLGSWFRDYIYIPMGGNRVSKLKWLRNILIVWFVTGFWHGAAWNFIFWGLFFGLFLVVEKFWLKEFLDKHKTIGHIYTLFLVLISFVIFANDSLPALGTALGSMFFANGAPLVSSQMLYYLRSYAVLLIVAAIGATPLPKILAKKLTSKHETVDTAATLILCFAVFVLCTGYLIDDSFNPFLYFRF